MPRKPAKKPRKTMDRKQMKKTRGGGVNVAAGFITNNRDDQAIAPRTLTGGV